jgi:arylsulfatase A-like enzyme
MRALLLALAAAFGSAAGAAPPNVVVIVTDDMRRDDLVYMPYVQELLVDAGTSFSAAFVNVALCCPSRATMLRGQYSHNTHLIENAIGSAGPALLEALSERVAALRTCRGVTCSALEDAPLP